MQSGRIKNRWIINLMMSLPWYVSILLGEAAFVAFKWILPVMCASNPLLKSIAVDLAGMAWFFCAIFLLIGLFAYATQKRRRLSGSAVFTGF